MSGSGTDIPLMVKPVDIPGAQLANMKPLSELYNQQQTQASTAQSQAQAGLIGANTQAAEMQNQITAARLPAITALYGAYAGALNGSGSPGAGPGGGPPGAIGAAAGQNWTGPDGIILPPGVPGSELGAIPKSWVLQIANADPKDVQKTIADLRVQKNAYVNQAMAATIDPATGQADPDKWNQMVSDELKSGMMDAKNARDLYGHPEQAQIRLNSTLPAGEQPGTKASQTAAVKGTEAGYELVKVNAPVLDANGQPTGQTQDQYFRKSDLLPNGQPKPGAATAQYGPPIQATELPSAAQKLLRALSPSEANSPNQRYVPPGSNRPATFDTSQGHPGEGAAGLFQFEPETWARGAQLAGVDPKNMSQANQERVAWAVAQDDYEKRTGGRSLAFDINRGNVSQVAAGLKGTWPSITGGDQQNAVGQTFTARLAALNGGQAGAGGGAAPAGAAAPGGAAPAGGPGYAPGTPLATATPNPQAPGVTGGPTPVAAAGAPAFTPGVAASREVDKDLIDKDREINQANLDAAQKATQASVGIKEARDLVANVPTGAFADQRIQLQSIAKQTGSPVIQKLATAVSGLNSDQLNDAEVARKLYQANVVKEEQGVGNARIGAMFTNFFAKASPNLSLQNGALNEMTNAALIGQQMTKDFANGSTDHVSTATTNYQAGLTGGRYQPYVPLREYEKTWTAPDSVHSADTYAAAVHLLNGAPISTAFKDLKPAQYNEAVQVISRADPGAIPKLMARPDVIQWRKEIAGQAAQ
jgi:hypothetical protein